MIHQLFRQSLSKTSSYTQTCWPGKFQIFPGTPDQLFTPHLFLTTDDTDKTDFYGFFIRVDPYNPLNPWLIFSGE
jgi:hypothetical protein